MNGEEYQGVRRYQQICEKRERFYSGSDVRIVYFDFDSYGEKHMLFPCRAGLEVCDDELFRLFPLYRGLGA